MSEVEGKETGVSYNQHLQYDPQLQYGTFQGVANYPPQPVVGFPPSAPPPGAVPSPDGPPQPHYFSHGYQAFPGYAIVEGRPVIERGRPFCGCGNGWFLFIIGFFLAAIPWYAGAIILLCARSRSVHYRDKPGYIACSIAALITTILIIFGSADDDWYDW